MKIISNGDKLSVFVINNKDIDLDNLDMYMKELIIKLRRKYRKDIYGFYKVDVYVKDKIGMIIDFNLEEEIDFFRDLVDLKVVVHEDADLFLKFSDYFLFDNKKVYFFEEEYYVDINDVSDKEFLEKLEFCNLVYGEELSDIKGNFKKICSAWKL